MNTLEESKNGRRGGLYSTWAEDVEHEDDVACDVCDGWNSESLMTTCFQCNSITCPHCSGDDQWCYSMRCYSIPCATPECDSILSLTKEIDDISTGIHAFGYCTSCHESKTKCLQCGIAKPDSEVIHTLCHQCNQKKCQLCKETLPISIFSKSEWTMSHRCKPCLRTYQKRCYHIARNERNVRVRRNATILKDSVNRRER